MSLLYVKGNLVAFIEGFKTGLHDCLMMNKHIMSASPLNKSESFLVAKPPGSSIGRNNIPLFLKFSTLQTGGCHFDKRLALQNETAPPINKVGLD